MAAPSRPSANRQGADLVVMGCAGEDAESLREALEALRQDGLEVELCEGLDHDPKRLSDLIERRDGRGLYVLCRSPNLGRERVEELREILLARHIPFARTLTVAVGGRGALADRIRAGLRRASARTSGPSRSAKGSAKEPAKGAATPRLIPAARSRGLPTVATEDEEPTLVGKRELDEFESSPTVPPLASAPRPAPPAPPAPTPEISVVETIDEDLLTEDTSASWSGAAIVSADLDLSDLDAGNTGRGPVPQLETTAVGVVPALITGDTVIGPTPAIITGDTLVGGKLPRSLREAAGRWPLSTDPQTAGLPAELEPVTMPLPRSTPASPAGALPRPPAPPPSGPPPGAWASPSPAASMLGAPASTSTAGMSTVRGVSAGRIKPLPWALASVAVLLFALVMALAVSDDPADSEVASSSTPSGGDAATPDRAASDSSPGDAEATPDPTPEARVDYPVVTALRSRKVRALDVLLIATTLGNPSDYPAAAAYCDSLEIEGLRGWRLPQIGELSTLATANMISRGMYWSSTAADTFGDDHMAWNVRRGHAAPHNEDAVAVCVRGGASG